MKKNRRWAGVLLSILLALNGLGLKEVQWVHAETQLASYQQSFIDKIGASAVQIARAHGLFPSVMIAQAILESDWGRSGLSLPPYYNLFGIKGGSDGVVFDTKEDDGTGNLYEIQDSFRRYNSYLESLEDYARLFTSTPYLTRVYANFVNASTVEEACQALTGTYATDTRYGSKLMSIIVGYNLFSFDGQVNRSPSWSLQETHDQVYCQYDQVNIRENHSTNSKIIGRANTGDRFLRLGTVTGWSCIQLPNGGKAYIASEFLGNNVPTEAKEEGNTEDLTLSQVSGGKPEGSAPAENGQDEANQKPEKEENKPSEPKPTEPQDENGTNAPSEEDQAKAREEADKAIQEGPSTATKDGLLDSRTAGVATEHPVDKSILEGYLGSNVDLPFTSEEVKKRYRETLQKAVQLYWSAQATQEEIDQVVSELAKLRTQAETEDADGTKRDNEKIRTLHDEKSNVEVKYTKLHFDQGDEPKLCVKMKPQGALEKQQQNKVTLKGQRWFVYQIEIQDQEGHRIFPKNSVTVKIPIPEKVKPADLELYFVKFNGDLEQRNFSFDQKNLRFQTKDTGSFILLERNVRFNQAKEARALYAYNEGLVTTAGTSSVESPYGVELVLLLIGFLLTASGRELYLYKKRKNK